MNSTRSRRAGPCCRWWREISSRSCPGYPESRCLVNFPRPHSYDPVEIHLDEAVSVTSRLFVPKSQGVESLMGDDSQLKSLIPGGKGID